MLRCHNCITRCLQTIIGDSVPIYSTTRRYLSVQSTSESSRAIYPESERRNRRQEWLESRGVRPVDKPKKYSDDKQYQLRRHLKFLKDPLLLAGHIRKCLQDDNFDTAQETVRAASKDVQCTVSWNHLIEWQLSKGKMNAALHTYNEMKKRAQAPDAQTYTIIFNGCSGHSEPAQALVKVLSIYRSMRAEKSPIKPNIKHINAVLKMCARANDMDALFATASEIPKSGIGAADCLTYTTILNALRMNAIEEAPKPLSPRQKRKATEQAILRARLIWADVVKQWRKGDVFVDENLVCTMGRLLVLGGPKDSDDIFSLIEQTMNIPRQLPPMGTPERSKIEPTEQGRMKDHSSTEITNAGSTDQPASADHSLMAIEPANTSLSVSSFYAKPGRNSLGLIMQALLEIKQKSPAALYWDIFTKDHGVIPDSENFHGYLRILRGFRSSTEVVELLLQMPKECMEKKTFRIAMSSCKADKLNRHAFGNAGKILDLMSQHLVVPDIPALECYLTVAIESKAYSPKISSNGEPHPSKYAQGRQILRALDRINPSFDNVKSLVAYGDPSRNQHLQEEGLKLQVLLLAQNMVRAYDVLIAKTLVPREMRIELSEHRGKLAAYITRSRHNPLPKPIHPSSKRLRPKIMSSQDPKGHLRARSRASDSRRS